MSASALEIKHIPLGEEDGLLTAREGEMLAAVAGRGLCALLSDALTGNADPGDMEIFLHGEAVFLSSPRAALKMGVAVVSPDSALAPGLSLLDHARLLPGIGRSKRKARKELEALCAEMGWEADLRAPAHALSPGERYRGEALLALLRGCSVLALREMEAALTPLEAEALAGVLRRECKAGKTVLLLTGRQGIAALADRVAALSPAAEDTPPERLELHVGSVALEVRGLKGHGLRDVSFEARAGEILAVAGVPGSGQQALGDALAGALPLKAGRLRLNGRDITGYSAIQRVRAGLGCVPGPEGNFGFPLDRLTLGESMTLRRCREPMYSESGILRRGEMNRYAEETLDWLDIQPGEEDAPENRLRCALARETAGNLQALAVVNPTKGLEEAAARDIWERLLAVRDERKAVVLITSDPREALLVGDRVLTLCGGEITGAFDPALTTEKELGLFMTGRRQGGEERFDEE